MSGALATSWAFVVRDYRLAVSYRFGFAFEILGALVNTVLFFFVSDFFGPVVAPQIEQYGGDYFAFVIIGIASTTYLSVGLTSVSNKIRDGQLMGTLELMLISPTRLPVTLLSSAIWSHVMATFAVVTYVVGAVLLGASADATNLPLVIVTLVIAILSFNAIGLIAAAVVIVFKHGSPINWLVSAASVLLAGVFYPTTAVPPALQSLAQLLPLTPALEVIRRALLQGEGLDTLAGPFLLLCGLTAIYLPIGILACHLAVRVAQRDGSLSTY
jgi:ABC-2 type transport system permease protein